MNEMSIAPVQPTVGRQKLTPEITAEFRVYVSNICDLLDSPKEILCDYLPRTAEAETRVLSRETREAFIQLFSEAGKLIHEPKQKRDQVPNLFTQREMQVLNVLVRGESNKNIARELELTVSTVKAHVSKIMRKAGATNRNEAAFIAKRSLPEFANYNAANVLENIRSVKEFAEKTDILVRRAPEFAQEYLWAVAVEEASKLPASGRNIIFELFTAASPDHQIRLTQLQWDVYQRLAQGKANKIIAYELSLSESMVKVHINNGIMRAAQASRRGAAIYNIEQAIREGNVVVNGHRLDSVDSSIPSRTNGAGVREAARHEGLI